MNLIIINLGSVITFLDRAVTQIRFWHLNVEAWIYNQDSPYEIFGLNLFWVRCLQRESENKKRKEEIF
jgi:hypothetical protein